MSDSIIVREVKEEDIFRIQEIYSYYVKNTTVSFEYEAPDKNETKNRIDKIQKSNYPYLVAVDTNANNKVIGFAYASEFNEREAYKYTCDLSIYIDEENHSVGIGQKLYDEIEKKLKNMGIVQLVSIIVDDNEKSINFHKKNDFYEIGHFKNSGYKFNKWLGVYWYCKTINNLDIVKSSDFVNSSETINSSNASSFPNGLLSEKVKLIAIDMDGTLLNDNKEIEIEQKKALKYAVDKGVHVVLCTGRPLFGVLPLYNTLNFGKANEYMIVNNGCSIHETHEYKLLDSFKLKNNEIEELYNLSKGFDVDFTLFTEDEYLFVGEKNEKPNNMTVYDSKFVYTPITQITLNEALNGKRNMFKSMFVGEVENINKFIENLPDNVKHKYNFTHSQDFIFEAMPLNADKGNAVKILAKRLGIKQEEVMALGDGNNDVEMLTYAGVSVAMGNGTESAKNAAKYETDTNENDGVAKAIYRFV